MPPLARHVIEPTSGLGTFDTGKQALGVAKPVDQSGRGHVWTPGHGPPAALNLDPALAQVARSRPSSFTAHGLKIGEPTEAVQFGEPFDGGGPGTPQRAWRCLAEAGEAELAAELLGAPLGIA